MTITPIGPLTIAVDENAQKDSQAARENHRAVLKAFREHAAKRCGEIMFSHFNAGAFTWDFMALVIDAALAEKDAESRDREQKLQAIIDDLVNQIAELKSPTLVPEFRKERFHNGVTYRVRNGELEANVDGRDQWEAARSGPTIKTKADADRMAALFANPYETPNHKGVTYVDSCFVDEAHNYDGEGAAAVAYLILKNPGRFTDDDHAPLMALKRALEATNA